MTDALEQIIAMNGLMTEEDYKYEGKQHQQCRLDQTKIKVKISSYLNISSDENGSIFSSCFSLRVELFFHFIQKWLNGWQKMVQYPLD